MPGNPIVIGGVNCYVDLTEGLKESWPGDGGPEVRVTFKCPYASRYTVANALMGPVTYTGGGIFRTAPFRYSRSTNLYVTSLGDIEGRGHPRVDSDGYPLYDWAFIPALFAVPRFQFELPGNPDPANGFIDPSGQPWTTTTINVSADVIKPPKGSYFFVGSSPAETVEDGSLGFLFPQVEITMKRERYPYLPLAELMALAGSVNDSSIKIGNFLFPAETLLFASGPSSQQVDTTGQVVTEFEIKLIGRTQSWNKLPNKSGVWTNINTNVNGSGQKPFRLANFGLIP